MFNLSDKELDRLSRKAADAYEVENNTSSWEALEQRLNKELGTPPSPSVPSSRIFRFPFAFASAIILLVGTGYFLLKPGKTTRANDKKNYSILHQQQNSDETPEKAFTGSSTDKPKAVTTSSATESQLPEPEKNTATNISPEEKASSLLNIKQKSSDFNSGMENFGLKNKDNNQEKGIVHNEGNANGTADKSASENSSIIHDSRNSTGYSSPKNKMPVSNNIETQNQRSTFITDKYEKPRSTDKFSADKSANADYSSGKKNIYNKNKPVTNSTPEDIPRYTSPLLASFKHPVVIINDSSLRAEKTENRLQDIIHLTKKTGKSLNTNRSLQIGILFAPDFSEVKHTDYANRLGTGAGITLGYQLLNSLSVNTGIIYSHKYYQANDESFHLARNIPLNGLRIEYVNGSVKMFEIPLNLRYDISTQGNTIFFVSGGISSYLMLHQNYLYYCHSYGLSSPGWYKQDFNSPQNFWFSTVNLSAGFEASLSNSFSLQVEPYIKIPMKGVGAGNVQLNSYGINFAFKFSPVLKRTRK